MVREQERSRYAARAGPAACARVRPFVPSEAWYVDAGGQHGYSGCRCDRPIATVAHPRATRSRRRAEHARR